ncbi:hypothetical protein ES706_03129 [subsurface metagenome]
MRDFRIIQHINLSLDSINDPICLLGMPGIADVGKFAIDQIIGLLKAKPYLEIIFNDYPAGAIVDDCLLSAPKAEIMFWKDPNNIRDFFLVTADSQALNPKGIYKISDFIASLMYKFKIKLIISLGAFPTNNPSKSPSIFFSTTNKDFIDQFIKDGKCKRIKKGVIVGANGLIPTLVKARFNIDGIVFLAETDNIAVINDEITDLKASISLINLLKENFNLPIERKYTLEKIDEITKNLKIKKEKLERDLDNFHLMDKNSEEKRKSLYI